MLEENNSQLRLFVQESRNRVKLCLDDLGTLAQNTPEQRSGAFERLLRTTRGIGGSARFHALPQLVRLCQSLESFLGRFRSHLLNARPEFVSIAMQSLEKFGVLLADPMAAKNISIDPEILAIQSMLAAHADPPEFNLADHPRALATAVTQGLDFYSIHIPLSGDPEANRAQFQQIKAAVEVVATLVASKPDLGAQFEWRNDLPGGMIRLLLSTVLPGEILHGLIQLPQERIVRLEIPESLSQTVTAEMERQAQEASLAKIQAEEPVEDMLAETQLGEVEERTRLIALSENVQPDLLEETQLGEAEERTRQAHFEEMRRQEILREEHRRQQVQQTANEETQRERERQERASRQAQERQRQEAEAEQSLARNRQAVRRRGIYGGLVAAGLLIAVAYQAGMLPQIEALSMLLASKESDGKPIPAVKESSTAKLVSATTPPQSNKPVAAPEIKTPPIVVASVAPPAVAPAPPVPPKESPAVVTPPKEPPAVVTEPSTVVMPPKEQQPAVVTPPKEPSAVVTPPKELPAVAFAPPAEKTDSGSISFSSLMLGRNNLPNMDVKAAEQADRSSAPPGSVKSAERVVSESWQHEFARHYTQMVRMTKDPYKKFIPAKKTKHGSIRVRRNPNGDMLFSIAEMMGHTAIRQNDDFKLTPDSMAKLRFVFQLEHGYGYMFELDRNGEAVIPNAFWSEFSKVSKKAVSISRVVKETPEGLHLRDLTALTMSYILRTAPGKE